MLNTAIVFIGALASLLMAPDQAPASSFSEVVCYVPNGTSSRQWIPNEGLAQATSECHQIGGFLFIVNHE